VRAGRALIPRVDHLSFNRLIVEAGALRRCGWPGMAARGVPRGLQFRVDVDDITSEDRSCAGKPLHGLTHV